VDAALDLLDEVGLDGVTVRAVAARLGVQAPALYWHVRNKQDLLDEAATEIWRRITAEMAALPEDLAWQQAFTAFATTTRRTLLSYRDGAKTFSGTYLTDPDVLAQQEALIGRMVKQGFAVRDVIRANGLIYHFVIGFCVEEQAVAQVTAAGDDRYSLERRAERLDVETHPLVQESGEEIFGDPQARFDDAVRLILQTIATLP
jgi:AcrR family transcriptional regulator